MGIYRHVRRSGLMQTQVRTPSKDQDRCEMARISLDFLAVDDLVCYSEISCPCVGSRLAVTSWSEKTGLAKIGRSGTESCTVGGMRWGLGDRNDSIHHRRRIRDLGLETLEARQMLAGDLHDVPLHQAQINSYPTEFEMAAGAVLEHHQSGEISGAVWSDSNSDGIQQAEEIGLQGWVVFVDTNATEQFEPPEPFGITDSLGRFLIEDLDVGTYQLYQVLQPGWESTHPVSGGPAFHLVTLDGESKKPEFNFGNLLIDSSLRGEIRGTKWHDLDGNGVRDSGEVGLAGWTVFLDTNGNDIQDANERSTITRGDDPETPVDEAGTYQLPMLEPGTYDVAEVQQENWVQTYPAPGLTSMTTGGGAARSSYHQGDADDLGPLLPDLIAWEDVQRNYIHGWSLDQNEIPGRTLLRLTTSVANIGAGPLEIRGDTIHGDGTQDVLQRIYNSDGSFTDQMAGTFSYHPEHGHIHFDRFTQFHLREVTADDGVGAIVSSGNKSSFCLIDVRSYDETLPGAPGLRQYHACNEYQGISVGWADIYIKALPDQWIDVTGVADGRYWLEVEIDPEHWIVESDETNNVSRILIDLENSGGPVSQGVHRVDVTGGEVVESIDFGNRWVSASELTIVSFDVISDNITDGFANVSVTIANQGEVSSDPFELDIIWSDDGEIGNSDDIVVDTLSLPGLDAEGQLQRTVEIELDRAELFARALRDDSPALVSGHVSRVVDLFGAVVTGAAVGSHQHDDSHEHQDGNMGVDRDDVTYLLWDTQGQGDVTPSDAVYVLNRMGGSETKADIDGNGVITMSDAVAIVNRIGYLINKGPLQDGLGFAVNLEPENTAHGILGDPLTAVAMELNEEILNAEPNTGVIQGIKWDDRNGDAILDSSEPLLSGWTLFLDEDDDGFLDLDETWTVTSTDDPETPENDAGRYSFQDLASGEYVVTAVNRDGWRQTFPEPPASEFNIVVRFTDNSLSASQQVLFENAARRWGEIVIGDVPDVHTSIGMVDDMTIDARAITIDGSGGVLANANPSWFRPGSRIPARGLMSFDSADVFRLERDGLLPAVILHEMGHVLGFGTQWMSHGLISGGEDGPHFSGPRAVVEYQQIFSVSETTVPVANTGDSGTRNVHWRESTFDNELMTGFLNQQGDTLPISRITAGSMADLGYEVDLLAADPFSLSLDVVESSGTVVSTGWFLTLSEQPLFAELVQPAYAGNLVSARVTEADEVENQSQDRVWRVYLDEGEIEGTVNFGSQRRATNILSGDLVAKSFNVTSDQLLRGQAEVTFEIENQGIDAIEAFEVDLVWSDDNLFGNTDDLVLSSFSFNGVDSGKSVSQRVEVQLDRVALFDRALRDDPVGMDTGYVSREVDWLGIVIDPDNLIFEVDENNNQNIGKGRDMDDVSYFPWDLTGSGEVTEMDAVFVLNRVGANDGIADLDGNGLVNSADVMAVIDRIGYLGNWEIIEPTSNDPIQVKDMPVYLMTRTPVHDGSVQTYLLHVLDQLPSTADVEISEIMILLKANSITSSPISKHVRVQDTVFGLL